MSLPTSTPLDRNEIQQLIHQFFRENDQAAAMAVLERYGVDEPQQIRVQAAAVRLSAGDLWKLQARIQEARRDYQKVLEQADFEQASRAAAHSLRRKLSNVGLALAAALAVLLVWLALGRPTFEFLLPVR
jgi:hypothetical protein